DDLGVRSLWLGRFALASLVGGDSLGLSRGRDRLLSHLQRGLSVERDLPNFLRFLGRGSRGDAATTTVLVKHLDDLVDRYQKTKRRRSVMEAHPSLTDPYVRLVFAWGFARLGRVDRARTMRDEALDSLDTKDSIHGVSAASYSARIQQALEGMPPESPLPVEIRGQMNSLDVFVRYKVDRLRQASRILEPQERLDPATAFQVASETGEQDPRGPEFSQLRGMHDVGQLVEAIEAILTAAHSAPVKDRARLYDGAMDFFPLLPAGRVSPWLDELTSRFDDIEPVYRALLMEEALMLSGFFGRIELATLLINSLRGLLKSLDAATTTEIASKLGGCLRALRRFGLREAAASLLDTLGGAVTGESHEALIGRLNVAAGMAFLGNLESAKPAFEAAFKALKGKLLVAERLKITRALADALTQTPQEYAVQGMNTLETQLPQITDSLATNSHFCLTVVEFIECLVLGYVSEDLALGELGRRWLDEDEYLVRRRVHRDLGQMRAQQ
ncbi:MAG: hypothetical protein HN348_29480, partial [Proteobacteria bacterium]|nr:hypothetical protein [Pseudomonadota bacterium]